MMWLSCLTGWYLNNDYFNFCPQGVKIWGKKSFEEDSVLRSGPCCGGRGMQWLQHPGNLDFFILDGIVHLQLRGLDFWEGNSALDIRER